MRWTLRTAGALALFGLGVAACGSVGISDVPLGFNIVEGLLLVDQLDQTVGTVVLASVAGNCNAFQAGASFDQISGVDFLTFQLESLAPDLSLLPLSAGPYTILIPSATGPQDAGLYAASIEYETDPSCNFTPTGANSGTVTIDPFTWDAGGTSDVSYIVVFGYNRFTGAYPLKTCVIPSPPATLDGGSCLPPGGYAPP